MELWSNLDTNTNTDGRDRHRHIRRLSESLVIATLRVWLLDDYVPSYCRSLAMTHIYKRCYWIDALGVPKASETLELVQAVQSLSNTLAQESKPITLLGLLFEQQTQSSKARHKGGVRQTITLPKTSGTIHASWLEAAPTLLPELEQAPTIFLLNPFGRTMFTADDLTALYKRTAPTELCLLLSHKQVETLLLTALRSPAYAIALNAILRNDKWKTLDVQGEEQRTQAVSAVIELFVKAMQRHFALPIQRIALPMNVRPAVVEQVPYTLLFATRRQDSLICMNDALCRYRRSISEQSHRGILAEEWFAAQQRVRREEERTQLLNSLEQYGKAQHPRRWPDLRQQALLNHFGQFLLSEYDEAIQTLITNRVVVCEWRRKAANDGNGGNDPPIPGNDDVLVW